MTDHKFKCYEVLVDIFIKEGAACAAFEPKSKDDLAVVQACIRRAKRMLKEQASLTAEIKPRPEAVSVEELVKRAVRGVLPPEEKLRFEGAADRKNIRVDPDLMEQVFRELILYAARRVEKDLELTVRVHDYGEKVCISLHDNGPTIPCDEKDRIFDPFSDYGRSPRGWGLPTVRRIIEAHGGKIEVGRSEVGAQFLIYLPSKGAPE